MTSEQITTFTRVRMLLIRLLNRGETPDQEHVRKLIERDMQRRAIRKSHR